MNWARRLKRVFGIEIDGVAWGASGAAGPRLACVGVDILPRSAV
jgi:hypothetical protein